jgi:Ca-activated chloride channel family protein
MRFSFGMFCGVAFASVMLTQRPLAQEPFTLKVHTDEVALSFHAEDEKGQPVTDLIQSDIRLLDNGHAPSRVTLFVHHKELPVHLAIVFDMSPSMQDVISPRRIARQVAESALNAPGDQAMVIRFDFETQVQQDWTSDASLLVNAAAHVTDKNGTRLGGTAIWDSLYRTCHDHVVNQVPGAETAANAIVLFTDGVDNWSHARIEDAVEECQQKQTPIYPFVLDDKSRMNTGQKALRLIAEQTGGRVFYQQDLGANVTTSILQMGNDLRDRYTLVYRPAKMNLDGRFHSIKLDAPKRTAFFTVRSGYTAAP